MYVLPEVDPDNKLKCRISPPFGGGPILYKFSDYDVTITVPDSKGLFIPFTFKAMVAESMLNVMQLKKLDAVNFQSAVWKEAYYVLAIRAMERWAKVLNVRMLNIQTPDKVALEAMLEQDFSEFSVLDKEDTFSASGRKWYDRIK